MKGYSVKNIKTGDIFYLHTKNVTDKFISYYFSYEIVGSIPLPDGYKVVFNGRGQPVIKRRKSE